MTYHNETKISIEFAIREVLDLKVHVKFID